MAFKSGIIKPYGNNRTQTSPQEVWTDGSITMEQAIDRIQSDDTISLMALYDTNLRVQNTTQMMEGAIGYSLEDLEKRQREKGAPFSLIMDRPQQGRFMTILEKITKGEERFVKE